MSDEIVLFCRGINHEGCRCDFYSWNDLRDHLTSVHGLSAREATDAASREQARYLKQEFMWDVGDHARGWTFETFPQHDDAGKQARARVQAWAEGADEARSLYLYGPPGTGKTGLAVAAVAHSFDLFSETTASFMNVRKWLHEQRVKLSNGGTTDFGKLTEADGNVLVLDDLGAERPTEWARETIAYVVEERHRNGGATIVTSNYSPSQLAKRLGHDDPLIGQRIVSRLIENCTQIKLDRADQRARIRSAA